MYSISTPTVGQMGGCKNDAPAPLSGFRWLAQQFLYTYKGSAWVPAFAGTMLRTGKYTSVSLRVLVILPGT